MHTSRWPWRRKQQSFDAWALRYLSFEFLLDLMPNGGRAVLYRSTLISILIYAGAVAFASRIEPGASWRPDMDAARKIVFETIPWFGAVFAGVYLALYARFASQWQYLASVYNQMMATAVQQPPIGHTPEAVLRIWQAGIIEDAEDLHLACKPMFASLVSVLLTRPAVRRQFVDHAPGGAERLIALEKKIQLALERDAASRTEHSPQAGAN